jgi:hypothetical protein
VLAAISFEQYRLLINLYAEIHNIMLGEPCGTPWFSLGRPPC